MPIKDQITLCNHIFNYYSGRWWNDCRSVIMVSFLWTPGPLQYDCRGALCLFSFVCFSKPSNQNLIHSMQAAEWTLWSINGFNYSIKALRRHWKLANNAVLEKEQLCLCVHTWPGQQCGLERHSDFTRIDFVYQIGVVYNRGRGSCLCLSMTKGFVLNLCICLLGCCAAWRNPRTLSLPQNEIFHLK